jgi:hypothetical protein
VDRLKCALFVFDVETDGIHDCPGTADSIRHRSIIILHRHGRVDAGYIAGERRTASVGMP